VNYILAQVINLIFQVFIILIFVDVIGSWLLYSRVRLPDFVFGILQGVHNITGVVLNPIRRLMPGLGGLDISPIIALFVLELLRRFIMNALLR
jgi:YggT family protein